MPLKEKLLIQRIRRTALRPGNRRGHGIGDDCAVLRIARDREALITTDFSLEDVHFRSQWHPPDSVGHRCLARGLSDIGPMQRFFPWLCLRIFRKSGSTGSSLDC